MSQEYWIRQPGNPQVYGPFTIEQVRAYASEGRLPRDGEVSLDQATWNLASSVPGLFEDVVAAPAPALGAALPMSYYSHVAAGEGTAGKPRNVVPFAIFAVLMAASGFGSAFFFSQIINASSPDMSLLNYALGGGCFYVVCAGVCLVLWLMWVYKVHEDMRNYTMGRYGISAGQAVGYSFIPLFDAVWAVYMPWRLAKQTQSLLQAQGKPFSATPVMVLQILSVVGALLYLTPIFYAGSMLYIQSGLNKVWKGAEV